MISVIIPTLDEAERLPEAVASVRAAAEPVEIVVADGGSRDGTPGVARRLGVRVVSAPAGRARQLNAAAAVARGDVLLFLHADTRLPPDFPDHVRAALAGPGVSAGAFDLEIDSKRSGLRAIEGLAWLRTHLFDLPYGDQAIFVRAAQFRAVGGFPTVPVMEDYELVRRLRRRGRIAIAAAPALTSARLWERAGLLRTTLANQLTILAWRLRLPPARVATLRQRLLGLPPPAASFRTA